MKKILSYRPDFLVTLIVLAVIAAVVLPVTGQASEIAKLVTSLAIALLFFLYGARLSPAEALKGLLHWRVHVLIVLFTFVAFPLLGLALTPLRHVLGEELFMGVLYLCLVPSTVQSSVAFTGIARGNVAASIVAASASSLLGVFLTPLLVLLLMSSSGGLHIDASTFGKISLQLLLPFVLGQLTRRWVGTIAAKPVTKKIDQISIGLVVYVSFSDAVSSGAFSTVSWLVLLGLVLGSVVIVYAMLALTSFVPKRLGFNYADQVAIQFAGTKKSLAAGLPMAAVMFAGADLGLLILPLMVFHQVQLVICSLRAAKYAAVVEQVGLERARTW